MAFIVKNYSQRAASLVAAAVILPFVAGGPVTAHHSLNAFDLESERIVTGTVLAFEWRAPHTLTRIEIEESGTILSLEGMSPDYLGRRGWNRLSLKPGDVVEVAYFPAKTGVPEGLFLRVTLADGTVRVMVDNP